MQWQLIVIETPPLPPTITSIDCLSIQLDPNSYTAGIPYSGIMYVNYEGGNGVSYSSGTEINSTGVTGLSATLTSGQLNTGEGILTYIVTGTPSASSPNIANFDIPTTFGSSGCTVSVGDNKFIVGKLRSFQTTVLATSFISNGGSRRLMNGKNVTNVTTTNRRSAYEFAANQSEFIIINGLRLDFIESYNNTSTSPKLFNTTANPITYGVSALSTNDAYTSGNNTVIVFVQK